MDESNQEMELEKLMTGHLVFWLKSCLMDADRLQDFSDLIDGPLIYEVLQQIDPDRNPSNQIQESHGNQSVRLKNLDIILDSLKTIYRVIIILKYFISSITKYCLYLQEDIGALILASPNIVTLSMYHEHANTMLHSFAAEARLLLVLLLGAAVQCSEKENFILKIKSLPLDIQLGIVENIKEVTESRTVVVNLDGTDVLPTDCLSLVTNSRDAYLSHYIELMTRHEHALMAVATSKHAAHGSANLALATAGISSSMAEQHQQTASMHLVVEIADWKSKIRKKDQELEEKCESLLECREELESTKAMVSKLKQEVSELSADARSAKMYRDELDAVRLKAERCERLEAELGRARDKLRELEYLKGLTTELREDNRMLLERTQELEEQLSRSRARSGTVIDLEAQIARLKQTNSDAAQEREELQEKVRDLMEENTQLQLRQLSASKSDSKCASQELDPNMPSSGGNSLLDQLASSAQSDVVRLNLENSRLRAELDNLKENLSLEKVSLETALENEKKKSVLKIC
ncbi:hypothetical protein B566_EDAN012740 [Ephemera danica]|nr:hypothetical protein B566_EDAN012740 [Ephemera danica]